MAHGLIIRSANDGSYTTALHISGSIAKFAELMNARAKEIGCRNSHFQNSNGLPDPEHYTTAYDLALIAREAMKNPLFREVARTRKYQITRSTNQEDTWLISKNKYLQWDPTTDGIKTGYTVAAGHCFVGTAVRKGYRTLTVILASKDWKTDYKALTDWAFANYSQEQVAPAGAVLARATVRGGSVQDIALQLASPVFCACRNGQKPKIAIAIEPLETLVAPVAKGQAAGFAVVSDGLGWSFRAPLVAAGAVGRPNIIAQVSGGHWSFFFLAGTLGASAYMIRRKARRMAFGARSR
jgi:D-alanyl-D-alanine carboxypeptidase (penicillin-binding protein 5/6)